MNETILKVLLNSIGNKKIAEGLKSFLLQNLTHDGKKVHIMLYEKEKEVYFQKYIFNPETSKYSTLGSQMSMSEMINILLNTVENE